VGRRAHRPDAAGRRNVEALAGYGVPEAEIAGVVGIDAKTLRRHYRVELKQGHTKANAKVAENLYRKATGEGPQSVTAAIFWLKTRAQWRETTSHEISGPEGSPLVEHDPRKLARAVVELLSSAVRPETRSSLRLPDPSWLER
jgi:hypothetical protein